MDPQALMAWVALFSAAASLGSDIVEGVQHLAGEKLTPEELAAVKAQWQENVDRSAKNAGL